MLLDKVLNEKHTLQAQIAEECDYNASILATKASEATIIAAKALGISPKYMTETENINIEEAEFFLEKV